MPDPDTLTRLVELVREAVDEQNPPPAPEWLTETRKRIARRKRRQRQQRRSES